MGGIRVLAPGPDAPEVVRLLLAVRSELRYSKRRLGRRLGVSHGTISTWEAGGGKPPLYLAAALRLLLAQAMDPEHVSGEALEQARGWLLMIELDAAAGNLTEDHRRALVDGLTRALAAVYGPTDPPASGALVA
jgi:DNA-binding XRE family transcriptional regulator